MKLKLVEAGWMGDWYCIEKADHDGREWLEQTGPNSFSLRCSARISDADVEGDAAEMLAIAKGIKERTGACFKRCAVSFEADGVHFCSPRNSRKDGVVTIEEADDLAVQIFEALSPSGEGEGDKNE